MSEPRTIIRDWWGRQIGLRESSAARALAARLNRGDAVAVLSERTVFELGRSLGLLTQPERLVPMVQILAAVREDRGGPLPRRLGQGDPPLLSPLRFERLLRAENADLATQIRRALPMVERACDVGALGTDMLNWTDTTRAAWAFRYHGANPPSPPGATDMPAESGEETDA